MKRPSGFDRQPDLAGPERHAEGEGSVDAPTAADGSAVDGSAAAGSAFADRPADREGSLAPSIPDEAPAPPQETSAVAPTIDLSEVRSRRAGALATPREVDPVREAEKRMREAERRLKRRERQERRRFSFADRRRRRVWIGVGAAVLALALFVVVGVFTPVMAVRKIEITGAATVNAADVQRALSRFEGTPLALVDEGEVRGALEPFPLIQRYAVERIPPETLLVRIVERVPVVSVESDGAFLQYDAAGVLVGSVGELTAGVPRAEGQVVNLESDAFAAAALSLRDMPADLRARVVSVSANGGEDVTLTLNDGVQVMWGSADSTARKALVLNSMMASLAANGTPVAYIDVSSTEAPVFR